ncbi:hypothetical protein G5714_014560 [Onychostoma macrolepis]|uniref:Uncharacterized protein n=1 Tax=Onychostoma macrolepis TaxID=369639 RepID=A0A7J6CD72_9TELE|nr:hypothetical protein G5714_014560 [Onychostoma macrolepis]
MQRQSGEFPFECVTREEATDHSSGNARTGTWEQRIGETRGREGTDEKSNNWGENSAQSPSVSADVTSEWGENSAQSPSISADAMSEWRVPF